MCNILERCDVHLEEDGVVWNFIKTVGITNRPPSDLHPTNPGATMRENNTREETV